MACKGRCAGCGETGQLKRVLAHTVTCPKWAALYRENAAAALPPDQEYDRWLADDRPAEKAAAVEERVARTDDARGVMALRFRSRDPLEDVD